MSIRIPTEGPHARCVRAAIDGLASIDDCRRLGGQVAGFVAAAGGLVIDHLFVHGETEFGFRLWASREDLVNFAAGMRASLRCLVDRPERRAPDLRNRSAPRIEVNVALAPLPDPLSPLVLDALEGAIDADRLAGVAQALATQRGWADPADAALVERARRLLALRPEAVSPSAHLHMLVGKLGFARTAMPFLHESLAGSRRES